MKKTKSTIDNLWNKIEREIEFQILQESVLSSDKDELFEDEEPSTEISINRAELTVNAIKQIIKSEGYTLVKQDA